MSGVPAARARRPADGMHRVRLRDRHELVIGGMVGDLVDALPEAVEARKLRRIAICRTGKFHDPLASEHLAERPRPLRREGCALAFERRDDERVGVEQVDVDERRRLVRHRVAVEDGNGLPWRHGLAGKAASYTRFKP